ncbi:hypothetical protein M0R45_008844 [Rubus argutus]|uniref:Endonuclease/exonuclease/phosphatase domain-containing protein n=1 Tax=Rubus argutus TaxID=59490 RepID=A0AAW1Y4W8_RUBAR
MKNLYWNARGIANGDTKRALKNLVLLHKRLFVCIAEPFVLVNSILVSYWRSMSIRQLWNELGTIHSQYGVGPWVVLGDFNCVLGAHEKRGGGPPIASSCHDFQKMCDNCELIDIPTKGLSFTWSNRRTEVRLDRALANLNWIESWYSLECCTLTRVTSDHCPILLSCSRLLSVAKFPFRFQSMWLQMPTVTTQLP